MSKRLLFVLIVLILLLTACGGDKKSPPFPPIGTLLPDGYTNAQWTPVVQSFDGVEMVLVPAGCFQMGNEHSFDDSRPVHEVCLSAYWIDKTEVTNAQFAAFNGQAEKPSWDTGDNQPRDLLTWNEADQFCKSRGASLPTEAQWEYAARGPEGWLVPWAAEDTRGYVGWCIHASDVGSDPNDVSWVGALDLAGSVWEWVSDWYGPYSGKRQINPDGPSSPSRHIIRGGSCKGDYPINATDRFTANTPDSRSDDRGVRCVRPYEG